MIEEGFKDNEINHDGLGKKKESWEENLNEKKDSHQEIVDDLLEKSRSKQETIESNIESIGGKEKLKEIIDQLDPETLNSMVNKVIDSSAEEDKEIRTELKKHERFLNILSSLAVGAVNSGILLETLSLKAGKEHDSSFDLFLDLAKTDVPLFAGVALLAALGRYIYKKL